MMTRFNLRRLLPFRFQRFIIYERAIAPNPDLPGTSLPFSCRWLTIEDLPKFAGLVPAVQLPELKRRFEQNELCQGLLDGTSLVAFNWISLTKAVDDRNQIRFDLAPGEAYSYHFYVRSDLRGRGLGTAMSLVKDSYLSSLGVTRQISVVDFRNYASRRMVYKTGNRPIKLIYVITVLGKKLHFAWRFTGPPPEARPEASDGLNRRTDG